MSFILFLMAAAIVFGLPTGLLYMIENDIYINITPSARREAAYQKELDKYSWEAVYRAKKDVESW